jgi:acyl phosphate:glycerol-3-phosphate acyltransferase
MNTTAAWFFWLAGAYLVGSIPFGLLIGLARGVDIRDSGSGNVGATNAGRVLGKSWGLLCFLLDVGKGLGPTLGYGLWAGLACLDPGLDPGGTLGVTSGGVSGTEVGGMVAALGWLAVSVAAVLGHVFPIWLRFKGGKGVATGLGVVLGFWPVLTIPGVIAGLSWVVVAKRTGYVSLASILAACSLPVLAVVSAICWGRSAGETTVYAGVTLVLALLIVVRHRGNLGRLRAGTEPKAGWAKKEAK